MNTDSQPFKDFHTVLFQQPLWQNNAMPPILSLIRQDLQSNFSFLESQYALHSSELETQYKLGRYFEALWKIYLENSSYLELLEHNIQINRNGKTLGEVDFILLNKTNGQTVHLETSIKFYLSVYLNNRLFYVGSNSKDRLDKKVNHLKQKQLPLLRHSPLDKYSIDSRAGIISGYLFNQASYILGYKWISENQLSSKNLFSRLEKRSWISGSLTSPFSPIVTLQQPELFIHQESGSKVFIAPKEWVQSIIL